MYFDEKSYISRQDAADMIGVSRGYMQDTEKQGLNLPSGMSRYFPELNKYMERLEVNKVGKLVFYKQSQIEKLKDLIEKRNSAKRLFRAK